MDRIRALREQRHWSQHQLAERAGVTRQLVGAVEAGRHAPSVTAAIALAQALGTSVEDLFAPSASPVGVHGEPLAPGAGVVAARVGRHLVGVPLDHGAVDTERWAVADAVVTDDGLAWLPGGSADGVVVAGCDPALGLLATLAAAARSHRIITVHASTGRAVTALDAGRVHGALVHGRAGELPTPDRPVQRWHLARWQVGLASRRASGPPPVDELAERRARVVQREPGAGAQAALARALRGAGAPVDLPGPVADGHLDAARRVGSGAGVAGVTMEAAAAAYGLGFTPLEEHVVELWVDDRWRSSPAVVALVDTLGDTAFTRRAAAIGGYDLAHCGSRA